MSRTSNKTSYEIMTSAVDENFIPTKEEIKKINSFFFIKYISNDPNTIYIANAINCYSNIPIEAQYNFIKYSTLNKVAFIKYPPKSDTREVKVLMKHYKISKEVALDYLKILPEDKLDDLVRAYEKIKL